MPIRCIVRASCAAAIAGSLVAGIPGEGAVWAMGHVLAVGISLFLVWASMRAGYRALGFALAAVALPTWAMLLLEAASISAFCLGGAMLLGIGSCIVHYQSDPLVLGAGKKH